MIWLFPNKILTKHKTLSLLTINMRPRLEIILSSLNHAPLVWRWEKPQEGGIELCFWKLLLLRSEELFSGSESEVVQSLCASDKCKEQRKKEHKQLCRFLPQTGSSPVPLALPRRVPLKCKIKLQVAQSHKKETSLCSRTTPRDFYAQSHLKETSMLKDNSKRLPLLNHNWKILILTITKNWIRFWILDIQSEVFTIQYETEQILFF